MKPTLFTPVLVFAVSTGFAASCLAQQPWQRVSFDPARPAEVRSIRVTHDDGSGTNLVWLEFGKDQGGWFVLDTGAGVAVMDTSFAGRLGLTPGRTLSVNGRPATLRTAPSVTVGRITVSEPRFVTLDIGNLLTAPGAGFGPDAPVAGIVGYSLLQSVILRIEYGATADRVFLYGPETYTLPDDETWMTTRLIDRAPSVHGSAAGAEGLFKLDTGKTAAASLTAAFVAAHHLDAKFETRTATNRRIEGDVTERVTTLPYFELAGHRVERPDVSFRTAREETDSELAGVIGREILKAFTVTLNYTKQRIALSRRH